MRKYLFRKLTKHTAFIAVIYLLSSLLQFANAQLVLSGNSYSQHFDSITNTLPTGWSVDSGATSTFTGYDVSATYFFGTPSANTKWNNATARFKNVASATPYNFYADGTPAMQLSETNRALGIRQSGSFETNAAFVLTIANTNGLSNFMLSFKLQSLDSTCNRVTTWTVDYGIGNNPTAFTPVPASIPLTTGGNTFSNNMVNVDFGNSLDNQNGPVCIRIICLTPSTGSGSRTTSAIDDFFLSWTTGTNTNSITLTEKTPSGNNIALATNALTLKYDRDIVAGNGHIALYKNGQASAIGTYPVPSGAVIISDSTATVYGLSLENNTSYYIKMTSGIFTDTTGTLFNNSINDSVSWTFKTIDTITPPPPFLTALNESFTGCLDTAMGAFTAYSTTGERIWACSAQGHDDDAAVYIRGGIAAGLSEANEDWLISSRPFDFSLMSRPALSYWEKSRFEGNVIRRVKISTDYNAGTDPATASWSDLPVPNDKPSGDNFWANVHNIELTAYKNTPFFLAFVYKCSIDGAYELAYDDMKVSEYDPVKVNNIHNNQAEIKILGDAGREQIRLYISAGKADYFKIEIYDAVSRSIHQSGHKLPSGENICLIRNLNTAPGLHFIKISNGGYAQTIKAYIR